MTTPQPIIELKPARHNVFTPTDVLTWPLLGPFLKWPLSRRLMQTALLILTAFIIFDGLLGPQQAPKNLATVTAWIHYRGFVVLALLVAGNLFCMVCPFMLPREVGRWLGRRLGWQRGVPRAFRNKWAAAVVLGLFFVAYEWFDFWASPWLTGWIIVGYFLCAFAIDAFFQGAAFCKYVCPLGQFNFLGSMISPGEIKIRRADVCAACRTKDCIAGNRQTGRRGCELWLFQEKKVGNMDCTFCLDCVYACPHDNVGLIARVPTEELWRDPRRSGLGRLSARWDMVALVVVFIFGSYFNAFGMISPVYALQQTISRWLNTTAEWPSLFLIFGVGLVILPTMLLTGTAFLSRLLSGRREPLGSPLRRFTYALLPMGFGMWLAHYAFHFLTGALTLIPVTQSFLNDSGFYAGEPNWALGPLVPVEWLFPIQMIFLYAGLLGSLLVGFQAALYHYKQRDVALRAFIPWGILSILLLAAAIWIMFQPMEMRGTIFQGL